MSAPLSPSARAPARRWWLTKLGLTGALLGGFTGRLLARSPTDASTGEASGIRHALAKPRRTCGWVTDRRFRIPVFGRRHPEQPARIEAIEAAVETPSRLQHLLPIAAAPIDDRDLRLIHTAAHIASIYRRHGASTDITARTAVGGTLAAIEAVHAGRAYNAFVCSRPPGHHARNTGEEEGFCFYNHVAIGARHAQRRLGRSRILIVDWDYHHGDGTESFFYTDPSVLYFSTHDLAAYPGTGHAERIGAGAGEGFNINMPLGCGTTDDQIVAAFEQMLLPAAERFRPDFVLISAGFDSRRDDTLGCFDVTDDGYRRLTRIVCDIAERHCGGRLVSVLEGGYNIAGISSAVAAHVDELIARGQVSPFASTG